MIRHVLARYTHRLYKKCLHKIELKSLFLFSPPQVWPRPGAHASATSTSHAPRPAVADMVSYATKFAVTQTLSGDRYGDCRTSGSRSRLGNTVNPSADRRGSHFP